MICEWYNKMDDIGMYIVTGERVYSHESSITLHEFMVMFIMFILSILFMSWWMIPARIILSPLDKITFECKKRK